MALPVTRYAKSGDVHIAYQVFGSGTTDLVFVPGFISHLENYWDHPDLARWLLRLGRFTRVIMFDKRGTGLSDPVSKVPSMDLRMDDVRAVMDAAGSESAALLGVSEGGALAALFAATYPQRCQHLVPMVPLRVSQSQLRFSSRSSNISIVPGATDSVCRFLRRHVGLIPPCCNGGVGLSGRVGARRRSRYC